MKKILYSIFILTFVSFAWANPPFGGGGTGTGDEEDPDNDVPIDGGISLLIVAGSAFGARYLYKKAN